jgi:hypothetical protein
MLLSSDLDVNSWFKHCRMVEDTVSLRHCSVNHDPPLCPSLMSVPAIETTMESSLCFHSPHTVGEA